MLNSNFTLISLLKFNVVEVELSCLKALAAAVAVQSLSHV